MSDFISTFIKHTEDYESPTSFWKWAAYATISAILRDQVWKDDGDDKLYPNIYILFLAGSGARKGRPVVLSEKLMREFPQVKISSGRSSVQALIDDLTMVEGDPKTGKVAKSGSAIFYAPELSAGIVTDPAAIAVLTDIYDHKANYTTSLRGRGKTGGNSIVFSMFAASNEAMLEDSYTVKAIEGGLLARTFLVCPDEFRPSNSLLTKVDRTGSFKKLISFLQGISKLSGSISFTEDAATEYENWYKDFRESYRNKSDKSGVMGRLHTGILKIAILLAANQLTTVLERHHIEQAINDCIVLLPNYQKFMLAVGESPSSKIGSMLLSELFIAKDYKMTKSQIIQKYWASFTIQELDALTVMLEQGGLLEVVSGGSAGRTTFKLTQYAIESMASG